MEAQIVQFFSSVPSSVWVLLGASLGITGVQATIKAFVENEDNQLSPATNVLILAALSSLASGADFLTSSAQTNPTILGTHTVLLVGVTHLLYNFAIRPLLNVISDAQAHRASQKAATSATTEAPVNSTEAAA